jgi:HEAT repeat protein
MRMDDESRKKLERFWRRKLWLGLAAVGAIGLAAWRVAAVQDRYDDVLVQESRELPEKVYQELVAEVRKGVPIVPVREEVPKKYGYRGNRCDAISSLGALGEIRAVPELKKLLDNPINMVTSCKHDRLIGGPSVYTSAFIALGQIENSRSFDEVKTSFFRVPSDEVVNIWREFSERDDKEIRRSPGFRKEEIPDSSFYLPLPKFSDDPSQTQRNQQIIQSLKVPLNYLNTDYRSFRYWFANHQCWMIRGISDSLNIGGEEALNLLESFRKDRNSLQTICDSSSGHELLYSMPTYQVTYPWSKLDKLRQKTDEINKSRPVAIKKQNITLTKNIASLLTDKNVQTRTDSAYTLGWIGDKKAVPSLLATLNDKNNDKNPDIQLAAANALASLGESKAIPGIVAMIKRNNGNFDFQSIAAEVLGDIGDPQAIPEIVAMIKDYLKNPPQGLLSMDGKKFSNQDYDYNLPNVYWDTRAVRALNRLGDVSEFSALGLLKNSDEMVRAGAIGNLAQSLPLMKPGVIKEGPVKEALLKALDVPSRIVRYKATNAFYSNLLLQDGNVEGHRETYPKLLKNLSDPDFRYMTIALLNQHTHATSINDRQTATAIISALNSLNLVKGLAIEDSTRQAGDYLVSKLPLDEVSGKGIVMYRGRIFRDQMFKIGLSQDTSQSSIDQSRFKAVEILQTLADRNALTSEHRKAALPALMATYKKWNADRHSYLDRMKIVRLIKQIHESEKVGSLAQLHSRQFFYLETGILGAIGVTAIGLLLSSIRLRNPFSLFFSTYLLFPEEVVAELIALKQRRQTEKVRKWQIRLELAYEIITLVWAFHIQIRIDDLKLPPGGNRSAK